MGTSKVDAQSLKRELLDAFADTTDPGDGNLSDSADGAERDKVARLFAGKRRQDWLDRPLQMLQEGDYCQNIFFLSAPAYQHFLPIFLLASIFERLEAEAIPDQVYATLTRPSDPRDLGEYSRRVGRLSRAQLSIVAKVLRYLLDTSESKGERANIPKALESVEALIREKEGS